jgi:hypothetical protein
LTATLVEQKGGTSSVEQKTSSVEQKKLLRCANISSVEQNNSCMKQKLSCVEQILLRFDTMTIVRACVCVHAKQTRGARRLPVEPK